MSVIWVGSKKLYIITTDQGKFKVETDRLNYRQTIIDLSKKGYTHINICCLGRVI